MISPWARSNWVDNTFIDQSSVVKFIEYNWHLSALGNGAADTAAGSILSMFNFSTPPRRPTAVPESRDRESRKASPPRCAS